MKKTDAIEGLREVVVDDGRPVSERRDAATHLAALQDAAVDLAVADDDAELATLIAPWTYENAEERKVLGRYAERFRMPIAEARAVVCGKRKTQARYSAVRNRALPMLERLAVCQLILDDDAAKDGHYRRNGYTPEKLLASITSTTA